MVDLLKGNPGGWVDLQTENPTPTTPTASQRISSLVPGQIYTVSGNFKKTIDWSGGAIIGLSFGVGIDSNFLFEAADPGDYDWHSFNFDYEAASASVLLSLSAEINGTEVNYGIDNSAMYATPEPSVWSLIFLGSGLLLYLRRNKTHFHF